MAPHIDPAPLSRAQSASQTPPHQLTNHAWESVGKRPGKGSCLSIPSGGRPSRLRHTVLRPQAQGTVFRFPVLPEWHCLSAGKSMVSLQRHSVCGVLLPGVKLKPSPGFCGEWALLPQGPGWSRLILGEFSSKTITLMGPRDAVTLSTPNKAQPSRTPNPS